MPDSHNPLAEVFAIYVVPFIIIVSVIYFICSVVSCVVEAKAESEQTQKRVRIQIIDN